MKHSKLNIITLLIILAVVTIVPFIVIELGNGIHITNNKAKEYNAITIQELEEKQNLTLCVPDIIRESNGIKARVVADTFIELLSDNFVLKIGPFQGYEADPLALYDPVEKDYRYKVKESEKEFIRYRLEYPELTHCTIINWVSNGRAYGLILDRQYSEDEILKIMGVTTEQLEIYAEQKKSDTSENDNKNNQIVVENKYKFELPLSVEKIDIIEQEDTTLLYMGDSIIMVICKYDTLGFEDSNVYRMENGYQIKYPNTNIFDEGSTEYDDFETIRRNIEMIADSFEVIGGE